MIIMRLEIKAIWIQLIKPKSADQKAHCTFNNLSNDKKGAQL